MHHQQYMSSLSGSSSSSNNGSGSGGSVTGNMPLIASIANVKDSRWLTLEVCREFQRGKCTRPDQECKFAHPPTHVEVNSGKVIACFDSLKGKCNRSNPPCKYLHPPQHLRDILLQNGRNNLILRSIAMNLAANQPIYPQTGGHVPYGNGAILSSPLQATGGLTSYQHLAPTAGGQSTIVFNQAGQAFSIPISSLTGATTAMYAPDGSSYFSPVNQFTGQPTGPKTIRTDRLESYLELDTFYPTGATTEDDPNYANGFVPAYQQYSGQYQTIYARAPSVDVKDTSLINSTNASINVDPNSSSNNTVTEIKAVIDPVSSSSSITQQTKKRPLEDDTATTGAYLQLPPGTQLIAAPQYLQQTSQQAQQQHHHQQAAAAAAAAAAGQSNQQQAAVAALAQHHKRTAIADPKTGIPMAAYPVAAFSYPSPSPLPTMQFPQPYITAVPMTFTGYASHLPRI